MLGVESEVAGLQGHVPSIKVIVLVPGDGFGSNGERELNEQNS